MFFRSFSGAVGRVTILTVLFVAVALSAYAASMWLIDSGTVDAVLYTWHEIVDWSLGR